MSNKKNNINSFTFYRSTFDLINTIKIDDKKEILNAIVDYIFEDKKPDLDGHNLAIFNTLSYQLDKSKIRSKAGRTRKLEDNQNEKQNEIKKETKQNQIDNQNKNKKGNLKNIIYYLLNINIYLQNRGLLRGKVEEWLKYKEEIKDFYKSEIGFKRLLTQIEKNAEKYGEDKVCDLIDECMANGYKGIIFDKLEQQAKFNSKPKTAMEKVEEESRKFLARGDD